MRFTHWLLQRIPDSDKITALIQQAGSSGIPEYELRSNIELPRQLLDHLLQVLVPSRIVRIAECGGILAGDLGGTATTASKMLAGLDLTV
jgi:hypothetical protein